MCPIQSAFFLVIVVGYSCNPWLFVLLLHFSHSQSNWSSPSFSGTTYQNFFTTSELLSEMSKFHQHTNLYSKCSTLLGSSFSLIHIR